jgi:hypothetical protein
VSDGSRYILCSAMSVKNQLNQKTAIIKDFISSALRREGPEDYPQCTEGQSTPIRKDIES